MTLNARLAAVCLSLLTTSCYYSNHNALHPNSPQAERIKDLYWIMFGICAVVFVLVVGAWAWAFGVGSKRAEARVDARTQSTLRRNVAIAVVITALILVGLMVADYAVGRANSSYSATPRNALTIKAIGRQWWWEFVYEDSVASRSISSANELHIPTGRPILIKNESRDVIHSFWVPALQGKKDMLPGYTTTLWLRADRPGIYEGQCAEYCGHQHAKMRLTVIAHTPTEFARWYEASMRPAVQPTDSITKRGQEVFLAAQCVMCHSIRGTDAAAKLGPDLTHIASLRKIGANSIPNTRGHLAAWILDAQSLKPGVRMPPNQLSPADLNALLAYLEILK